MQNGSFLEARALPLVIDKERISLVSNNSVTAFKMYKRQN